MLQNLYKLIGAAVKLGCGQTLKGRPIGAIADPAKSKTYKYKYERTISPERMHEMYTKEDYTLQQIADLAGGITRERVRQLIRKVGGNDVVAARRIFIAVDKARASRRPFAERYDKYFGCTKGQVRALGNPHENGSLPMAFKTQKNNARHRGVKWCLSLLEWHEIWVRSGHLSERGVGKGRYAMTRIADQGPYSVDNVVIKTHEENSRESRLMDKARGTVKMYDYLGAKVTCSELAALAAIPCGTMYQRLQRMSVEEAASKPIKKNAKHLTRVAKTGTLAK